MNLLFICSGNICRSAMADAYARHALPRERRDEVIVASAGTLGIEGAPASHEAIEAMRELGVDLAGHRSRGVTAELVERSDVLVAMTADHLTELALRFPSLGGERHVIRAFEKEAEPRADAPDLEDPIGHPLEFYRDQLRVLVPCLDHLLAHLEGRSR